MAAKPIFIAGTNTNIGKTVVSAWLCLHSRWNYFKPISSASPGEETDRELVERVANVKTVPEIYSFTHPISPHLAARKVGIEIRLNKVVLPTLNSLIVEGAGGLLVPLNSKSLFIEIIQKHGFGVILVASSQLGTINHTLLSLEALGRRSIPVYGVIVNGRSNQDNCNAIEHFGKTKVLAQLPEWKEISTETLKNFQLTPELNKILRF